MVQEKTIEKLENSAVKLSITVPAEEVRTAYDGLVKKYAKTAQIKGFRKGKVPREVLERKFGDGFRAEALQDLLESSLREVLQEIDERPLPYVQPELQDEDLELDPDKDLSFSVTYDVFPDVQPGNYEGRTVTEPKIKITKDDENRELEQLRQQNALVIDKEEGVVAEGDIVTMTYEEVDQEDATVAGTRREEQTHTVGESSNYYQLDTELIGMQKDETRIIEKEYDQDSDHEELRGQKKRLRVTILQVKERDVPDLDDDFAQDVSDEFETLKDLRKDVRKRLEETAARRVREIKVEDLVTQVLEDSTIPIPESMVRSELESNWNNLAEQYGATPEQLQQLLTLQGKTREDLFEDWKPSAQERLKKSLLVQKLIDLEEIQVSDEEAEADIRRTAEERNADTEQILEYYRNNNLLSYVKQDIAERKLFDALLEKSTVKTGETKKYVDVVQENS